MRECRIRQSARSVDPYVSLLSFKLNFLPAHSLKTILLACTAILVAAPLLAQNPAQRETTGRAVRADRAPEIDGRTNDPVWAIAPPMTDFRQFDPGENAAPTFRTEARVA